MERLAIGNSRLPAKDKGGTGVQTRRGGCFTLPLAFCFVRCSAIPTRTSSWCATTTATLLPTPTSSTRTGMVSVRGACGRRVHLPSMTSLAVRLSASSFLCTFSFQVTCATTAPFAATQRKVRLGEKFCWRGLLTPQTAQERSGLWKIPLMLFCGRPFRLLESDAHFACAPAVFPFRAHSG
jgi:hypothetical protein